MTKQRIGKFLHVVGTVVETYKAYPYFKTPNNVFEKYIGELLRYRKIQYMDAAQIEDVAETMKSVISFIQNVIPPTAIDKAKFIDNLTGEYGKLVHGRETDLIHAKAG